MTDSPLSMQTAYASEAIYGAAHGDFILVDALNRHPDWKYTSHNFKNTVTDVGDHIPTEWHLLFEQYDATDKELFALYEHDKFLIAVRQDIRHSNVRLNTWAANRADALKPMEHLLDKLDPIKIDPKSNDVPVQFWYQGQHGPTSITRNIEASTFKDVRDNYSHEVRDELEGLISIRPPFDGGKLLLMEGPPGTGKTHFIRTLVKAWAPWCDANYVGDTEQFFSRTGDLLSLVLSPSNRHIDVEDFLTGEPDETVFTGAERYRLFIMEDTDEFLQADAKLRTGQAMSRLLNLADGLIGQGLNALFLITTNEKIENIHAAIRRPGRALANINFKPLSMDEARAWMKNHGGDPALVKEEMTVADLYDKVREQKHITRVPDDGKQKTGQYL